MDKEVVYFELNNWFAGEHYPVEESFLTWIGHDFGAGNNVNMNWLEENGFWAVEGQYPTEVRLTPTQFKRVLAEGNINVSNVVVN